MTTATTNWRDVFNPRRELLLLSSAALEICWAYGFFEMILNGTGHGQRGVSVFLFAALMIFAIYSSRLILNSNLPLARQQGTLVVIALVSILLTIRATLFSNYGLFDLSWLARMPGAIGNLFIVFSPETLLIIMGVFAWWRGVSLAQASLDFESVGFRFRWGVLMLALLALINTFFGRIDISGLLFAFFFFGLLAVALARQEDVGRSQSNVSLPLKGSWLVVLAGSALLVLALGILLASLLTPQGVRALFDLLKPIEPLLVLLLYLVLLVISFFVELVYNVVLWLLQRFGMSNAGRPPVPTPPRPPILTPQEATDFSAFAAYWDPIRVACAVLLFAGVLLMLALSLNQLQKRQREAGNETRESVPVSVELNPFRRLRNLFRRPHVEFDDSGIASIRRIYANLVRLATQRGFPRREAETPYEFMRELRAALPGVELEERAITEAYVRVHYGEYEPTPDEVARIREAWERIKGQETKSHDT